MENGIYLFWHGAADTLPRMHSAMIQADDPAAAAETFAHDVLYNDRLEGGHRIFVLGPFEQDRMESYVDDDRELQEVLQDALDKTVPFEFRLTQKWDPS